ncbi:MAG: hypothetical protein IRY99_21600 [Isosphaeraceae bacterium]|nr:hypothetical protein [Isosphaeraceae bacterium]
MAVQAVVPAGAPEGYGLTKWVTLALPGSSGYYTVARRQIRDPWRFWAEYPTWIKEQDALHIGTHPPGLLLWYAGVLRVLEAHPEVARFIDERMPSSVALGFRTIIGPLPRADRAALVMTGALTLLACSATVIPLYALARSRRSAAEAWAAAALWPLVPSAILFQPTADTALPLLSTAALALAARGGVRSALIAGVVLAVGMQLTLAFLAVGLVVALLHATAPGLSWPRRNARIWVTGAGFLGLTLALWAISRANPFVIWWWNQKNHARFYMEYPRRYLAWLVANPIELVVALGLPAALWAALGLWTRPAPRVAWAMLAVLLLLTLSGRNLSEIARLWLPLMPPLLVSAGAGLVRFGGGPRTLAATIGLVGLQTMALQAMIQVVYPA